MPKITILHLSDLHFDPAIQQDSRIVIDALIKILSSHRKKSLLSPDIVAFTGDFVRAGENQETFKLAHEAFIAPVMNAVSLPLERLFMCPGNHDINRKLVRDEPWIETGLKESLKSVEQINQFIDAVNADPKRGEKPFERLQPWQSYDANILSKNYINSNPMLRTHKVRIQDTEIGIACFNTAWRATGEGDLKERGWLIIGERIIDTAICELSDCQLRLALHHHPSDWLVSDEQQTLPQRLYGAFDAILFGHLHSSQPELRQNMYGKAVLSQAGCIYESRRHFNGFQYLTLDTDNKTATFDVFTYYDSRREFDEATILPNRGKIQFTYGPQTENPRLRSIETIMQRARPAIRAEANAHIVLDHTVDNGQDIKDLFVCPPISLEPEFMSYVTKVEKDIRLDDILSTAGNVVFAGSRESGKTSLAHYISVRTSEGVGDRARIPVVLDFNKFEFRNPLRPRNLLRRAFTQYLPDLADDMSFGERLDAGDFLFIADNVQLSSDERRTILEGVMNEGAGNRWICLTETINPLRHGRKYEQEAFPGFEIYFINALPRRSIRELARRWCAPSQLDDRDAFTRVMAQITSAGLPRSGYIVSLLLWALVQRRELERVNEATLLQNLIEFMLDKADFQGALRKEFDFRSKELLLQHIAKYLKDRFGRAPINELTAFVVNFFNERGLDFNVNIVLDKLIESRVLTLDNDVISFRYRCFQDYFGAGRLNEDNAELDQILSGNEILLYAREIELMTGLSRTHSKVVDDLRTRLESLEPAWVKEADLAAFDHINSRKSAAPGLRRRVTQMRTKRLSADEIDEFMDQTDRRFREATDDPKGGSDVATLEAPEDMPLTPATLFLQLLLLFGKVSRNSEFIEAGKKQDAVVFFYRIWASYLHLWIKIADKLVSDIREKNPEAPDLPTKVGDALEYVFKTLMTVLISKLADDSIASPKLKPILIRVMDDAQQPMILRLLSAFTIIDGERRNWEKLFGKLLNDIDGNTYALRCLAERLYLYYRTKVLQPAERLEFEKFVSALEIALGAPSRDRGRIMQRIRTMNVVEAERE